MLNYIKSRLLTLTSSETNMAKKTTPKKVVRKLKPSTQIRQDAQTRFQASVLREMVPSDKISAEIWADAILEYLDENV